MSNTNCLLRLEEDKTVLRAFQLLEDLKRVVKLSDSSSDIDIFLIPKISSSHFKTALALHIKLKRLLLKRYILTLKLAYRKAVTEHELLYKECWHITQSEKHKLLNHTLLGYGQFSERHMFDHFSIKLFPEKLYSKHYQWNKIDGSFQKVLCLSQNFFNYSLAQIYYDSAVAYTEFHVPIAALVSIYLKISLKKLCYFDPSAITSDFISDIFHSCDVFNKFILSSRKDNISCCEHCSSFRSYKTLKLNVDWVYTIIFIAHSEANLASNKIVSTLMPIIHKTKKTLNDNCKLNWIPEEITQVIEQRNIITSDYSSASFSDVDFLNDGQFKKIRTEDKTGLQIDPSLISSFELILTRNQTLLLKYVYSKNRNHKNVENKDNFKAYSVGNEGCRKIWNGCHVHNMENYERIYWKHFWKRIEECMMKILLELPVHNGSDIIPGTLLLWRENSIAVLLKILKSAAESDDISFEGQECMKQMFLHIFYLVSFMAWDKIFCSTLASTRKHRNATVPLVDNTLGTRTGCLFLSALKPLLSNFYLNEWFQFMKCGIVVNARNNLMCTLDCFLNWAQLKQRASLSSWNLQDFLIVSFSDVARIQIVLRCLFSDFCNPSSSKSFTSRKQLKPLWILFQDKLKEIEKFNDGLQMDVYHRIYNWLYEKINCNKPSLCFSRVLDGSSNASSKENALEIVEMILLPLYETTLQVQSEEKWSIYGRTIESVAHCYSYFLHNDNAHISFKYMNMLRDEVTELLLWLETNLDFCKEESVIPSEVQEKITLCVKPLTIYESPKRSLTSRRNKVMPI